MHRELSNYISDVNMWPRRMDLNRLLRNQEKAVTYYLLLLRFFFQTQSIQANAFLSDQCHARTSQITSPRTASFYSIIDEVKLTIGSGGDREEGPCNLSGAGGSQISSVRFRIANIPARTDHQSDLIAQCHYFPFLIQDNNIQVRST